ncbi:2-(3-amino-3-carboxypropyl)histidine synthase subunit 2 [Abortiporus biennis]
MTENTAFSSSGEDVINRVLDISLEGSTDAFTEEEFLEYYDIHRTTNEIIQGDYKRIALQFPDELLHDSVPIYKALKGAIGPERELYVLADTSYGSCCVDEVAAQHVDADAVVHYGHACMSQTSRLPVVYVFGRKPIDVESCTRELLQSFRSSQQENKTVELRIDVAYAHKTEEVVARIRTEDPTIQVQFNPLPQKTTPVKTVEASSTNASSEVYEDENLSDSKTLFYVGGESLSLTNLLMTHSAYEVHAYDPSTKTARIESARTNKLLMRRYAAVQKARDADVFGILVGTLGVASYLPLITHLRAILKKVHKKSYTISVGKLNPAKLANFLEIECFVIVACPENSVIEAKEFLRPIVTPYELEIALRREPDWTGRYILDFKQVINSHVTEEAVEDKFDDEEEDQPEFSLITGTYRQAKRYGGTSSTIQDNEISSAIALRNQENTLSVMPDSAAAHFLKSRTYQGLEQRIGEDAPSVLEQGRSGIARGYEDDHR